MPRKYRNALSVWRSRLALGAGITACLLPWGVTAQTLTLHYQERPPYSRTEPAGAVSGLVATPALQALQAAGIPFTWALTPSQRQLALIQGGAGLHCGLGWFRTAERARLGKFSRPLYRDQPFVALARTDGPFPAALRVAEAFAIAPATLLVKEGYSYGAVFDGLIASAAQPVLRTSVDVPQMLRMLSAGRADWMVLAPEEAQFLLTGANAQGAGLRVVKFPDASAGEARHLYCSVGVPDDWLARIDRTLPR